MGAGIIVSHYNLFEGLILGYITISLKTQFSACALSLKLLNLCMDGCCGIESHIVYQGVLRHFSRGGGGEEHNWNRSLLENIVVHSKEFAVFLFILV